MSTNVPTEYQETRIEYVPKVKVTLEQAVDNLKKLDEIRRKIMRIGIDYDVIPGTPKPTLLKPGAERLLQFFGLGHKVQLIDKKEDWETGFFYYQYKVTVVKQYPDYAITVAECEGSANSKERRYRNQDVYSIVNTLQKMAIKRALVGATLQATGTSGMFTQDLEDIDMPNNSAPPQQQNGNDPASEAQKKAIFAIAKKLGANSEGEVLELLASIGFQVTGMDNISKKEASEIIKKANGIVADLDQKAKQNS